MSTETCENPLTIDGVTVCPVVLGPLVTEPQTPVVLGPSVTEPAAPVPVETIILVNEPPAELADTGLGVEAGFLGLLLLVVGMVLLSRRREARQ